MNNFEESVNSNIIPQQSEALILLEEVKSFFYTLNAKPDIEIRLLPDRKILELADIRAIDEQIAEKLRNHTVDAAITSINFILSNKKIKDYSTESLQQLFVLLVAVFMIGSFLGVQNERFTDEKIDKFEGHPRFYITRGDRKEIEEHEKSNNTLMKQLYYRIFWIIFAPLFTAFLKFVIKYIIKV